MPIKYEVKEYRYTSLFLLHYDLNDFFLIVPNSFLFLFFLRVHHILEGFLVHLTLNSKTLFTFL